MKVGDASHMPFTRKGKLSLRGIDTHDGDDPFYSLNELSDASGKSLSNDQIDDILYGQ